MRRELCAGLACTLYRITRSLVIARKLAHIAGGEDINQRIHVYGAGRQTDPARQKSRAVLVVFVGDNGRFAAQIVLLQQTRRILQVFTRIDGGILQQESDPRRCPAFAGPLQSQRLRNGFSPAPCPPLAIHTASGCACRYSAAVLIRRCNSVLGTSPFDLASQHDHRDIFLVSAHRIGKSPNHQTGQDPRPDHSQSQQEYNRTIYHPEYSSPFRQSAAEAGGQKYRRADAQAHRVSNVQHPHHNREQEP